MFVHVRTCPFLPEQVGGDLSGERIVRLSSRADCVLALNDKGELFGWGNNEYGQLLNATGEMQLHTPKHIKLNRKLKEVAAGGSSCIVLDGEYGSRMINYYYYYFIILVSY